MSRRVLAYVTCAVVVATVVAAVAIMGPPSEARRRRLDELRRGDLNLLSIAVDNYHDSQGRLPESLDDLAAVPTVRYRSRNDPETGLAYDYRVVDDNSYELCATFVGEGGDAADDDRFWAHGAGPKCFQLDVRKRE
jgi:hypothetical protein